MVFTFNCILLFCWRSYFIIMSNVLFGIIPKIETYRNPYEIAGTRAAKQILGNSSNVVVCTSQEDSFVSSEQYATEKEQLQNRLQAEYFSVLKSLLDELVYKQFRAVDFDDDLVLPWFNDHFTDIPVCWDTPDRPGVGVDYCGISLIPPDSARLMIERLTARAARVDEAERGELLRLIALLQRAVDEDRWAICFGV